MFDELQPNDDPHHPSDGDDGEPPVGVPPQTIPPSHPGYLGGYLPPTLTYDVLPQPPLAPSQEPHMGGVNHGPRPPVYDDSSAPLLYQLMPPYLAEGLALAPLPLDPYYVAEFPQAAPSAHQYYPMLYQQEWSHPGPMPLGFVLPVVNSQFFPENTPLPIKREEEYSYEMPMPVVQPPPALRAPTSSIVHTPGGLKRYRVLRGVLAGGLLTRPPKPQPGAPDMHFVLVDLQVNGAQPHDICYPQWLAGERADHRRIIRIERIQQGNKLIANFSIVGDANEHPVTLPLPQAGVDVVEVLCLECSVRPSDDYDLSDDENVHKFVRTEGDHAFQYYITLVEVIEIVELLIGTQAKDPAERRRERGRVRSNLVPFWLKRPISLRMNEPQQTPGVAPTNLDFRVELAKRIMGYEIRKPRGFDKEVRILRWDKLVPALKRALQSYYTEMHPHEVDQFYG